MKNIPEVGKVYTDRHGFTVTVTDVVKSGGGAAKFGQSERKGKLTGYRIEVLHGTTPHKMSLQEFNRRSFTCTEDRV